MGPVSVRQQKPMDFVQLMLKRDSFLSVVAVADVAKRMIYVKETIVSWSKRKKMLKRMRMLRRGVRRVSKKMICFVVDYLSVTTTTKTMS